MLTPEEEAATRRLWARVPRLLFWESPPRPVGLDRAEVLPLPAGSSHCAWQIGSYYFSAVPYVLDLLEGPLRDDYIMERGRDLIEDKRDFGPRFQVIEMMGLDGEAMVEEGRQIWASGVKYQVTPKLVSSSFTDWASSVKYEVTPRLVSGSFADAHGNWFARSSLLPQFNNAIVAMLLLVAGLPEDRQRAFRKKYYRDPAGYSWLGGRSPFWARQFAEPKQVYEYCRRYWNERDPL